MTDSKEDGKKDKDFLPIKVRRETWKLLKSLASWKEMSLADYVDAICTGKSSAREDLRIMQQEVTRLSKDFGKEGKQ